MVWVYYVVTTDVGDMDDNRLWVSWMPSSFVYAHEWLKASSSWNYHSPDDVFCVCGSYRSGASQDITLGRRIGNTEQGGLPSEAIRPGGVGNPRVQEGSAARLSLPIVASVCSCETHSEMMREERKAEVYSGAKGEGEAEDDDRVIREGICTCKWGRVGLETFSGGQESAGPGECRNHPRVEVHGARETSREASGWWWSELCSRTWPPKCHEGLLASEDKRWCVGRRSSVPPADNNTPPDHRSITDKLLSLFTCSVLRSKAASRTPACEAGSAPCAVAGAAECRECAGTRPRACPNWRCDSRGPVVKDTPKPLRLAERKKNEGNEYYKNKEYREALKLYTQAIDLCPDCAAYYSNRSACYMMLGKYYEALNDAREAVRLDTSFVKGYLRVAKCNIALGDATAALSVLRQAGEIEPNNRAIQEEVTKAQSLIRCQDEVAKATAKADYRTAIFHLDRALELAVGCRSLKITKAEYLVFLQRYGDAQEIVNDILQYDSGNADAIYVRGMCLYYQDNPDAAFSHFQHVLRLAPDHQKARDVYKKAKLLKQKKEEGNEAFKKGNYQEAFNLYTDALAIDPLNKHTNAKLYFNRATVGSKLNKLEQATEDCTAAINLDDGYVKAYLRRAKCYQLLEKHEEAVRDYERITKLDRSQEHKRLLQEAKIQLKRSKRKDYYKILGVNKNASDDEIKKSYRKMALVHHPDRHANASEKDKHEHEIKFKEIGEAYSVLTDAKKRAMYDRGQDINDPDGGFAHEDIDPNQIFQAFFGGGHGGYSFGGHTAGFQQGGFPGSGFTGASFPGGFHFQFG